MALSWAWAFGAETAADLEAMGWGMSSTSSSVIEPSTAEQYTYAGSPTRYSLTMDAGARATLPLSVSSPQGYRVITLKHTAVPRNGEPLIMVLGGNDRYIAIYMETSGAISLYVDSTYKLTTAIVDWTAWHTIGLYYSMSTTTWEGRIFIDGVGGSTGTDPGVAQISSRTELEGTATGDRTQHLAQITAWDDTADSTAPTPRYVTMIRPGADISETGTWTPTAPAATNHAVVGGVFASSTYTEEASPSAADEVVVAPATDIATALGITPGSIDGVVVSAFAEGLGHTARAEVGDGASTTTGATGVIDSATTERHAAAPTKPSGGSWSGTDTPQAVYHLVSV